MCSDGVIAKQLARAVLGWMGTAGYLVWPSFMTEKGFTAISPPVTGGLGASSESLSVFRRTIRERIFQLPDMTAGGGVFQGTTKGVFTLSLSIADFSEI